jgi:uncharacterized caspase-like protein
MKKSVAFFCLLLFVFINLSGCFHPPPPPPPPPPPSANRVALVIGNGGYNTQPLSSPVLDAKDMKTVLKDFGFSVTHLHNGNQIQMKNAIEKFGHQLKSGKEGLFYYSGHGIQKDGKNYMLPIGINNSNEFEKNAVSLDEVIRIMNKEERASDVNIIILDACRSKGKGGGGKGLATPNMNDAEGMLIAFATAPNSSAYDGSGSGRNSPYTEHLVKFIEEYPDQPIELILKEVAKAVKQDTTGKQIPWYNSSLIGDFKFKN